MNKQTTAAAQRKNRENNAFTRFFLTPTTSSFCCVRWIAKISAILFFTVHYQVFAEQVSFKKAKENQKTMFSYQWIDSFSQTQNLTFDLANKQNAKQVHKRYVPELAQQYVFIELHKAARLIDPREARIEIQRSTQDINVKVSSRSPKLLTKWQGSMAKSQEKAFDKYLHDHYYTRFYSHLGQEAVKADHLRYINENKAPLLPIAQAIYEKLPPNSESRIYVNLLLSWVQSIPYNELEDRMSSNGAGFLPPLALIRENIGDCDSKSVLTAGLIRYLLPEIKLVMVYLPQHALLGISLPDRSTEQTFNFGGSDYLLMEPTGPALMPLGTVAASSERAINSRLFSYEQVP